MSDVQMAAQSLGQQIHVVNAGRDGDFDSAFATLLEQRSGALLVTTDAFLYSRRYRILALATRHAIPAIYDRREFATAGGLLTYGANLRDCIPPNRQLHRQNSHGHQARRPAGHTADQVRAGDQRRYRNRPRRPLVVARPRRRGDRMSSRREFISDRAALGRTPLG